MSTTQYRTGFYTNTSTADELHDLQHCHANGVTTHYGNYSSIMEPDFMPEGWAQSPNPCTTDMLLAAANCLVQVGPVQQLSPSGTGYCFLSSISAHRVVVTPELVTYLIHA